VIQIASYRIKKTFVDITSPKMGEENIMWVIDESGKELTKQEKIRGRRVLIVEDSPLFRKLLKETLYSRFPSMEISEAENGVEALQKVNTLCPDLIFMDIKLPGENGLQLTAKIKAQCPDITVIILTSYDTQEYRDAAVQAKANYFLSKGSSTREGILTLVTSILNGK
jgi:DNA-binding NarL/FixJ family response regulator